jgi:hypothetical protein
MAMVCPQCDETFEQRLQCPVCGVRLLYQARSPRQGGGLGGVELSWQQTPWGRILIGLFLAQGLYYGFRNLCTAGHLVAGESSAHTVWSTLTGLILLQGLQAIGVLIAGGLAGAGQRQGFLYGGLVGVWNGLLFIVAQHATNGQELTVVALFGLPILQTAFGVVGGFVGSCIWRPLSSVAVPPAPRTPVPVGLGRRAQSAFTGPVAWGRVLTGITVAVGGSIWANVILDFVLEAAEGKLSIRSHLQAQLVTWEITALAMLTGSVLAGASTTNGLKQGLCVGLGTGAVLLGIGLANANLSLPQVLSTLASDVCLGLAGGWFGGQLLPPLYQPPVRKGLGGAAF